MSREQLTASFSAIRATIPGWCTDDKASALIGHILDRRAHLCIEIGVFGGSSLVPQAMAMKELNQGGKVYGIDPWTKDAALEEMKGQENKDWWSTLNLDQVYEGCKRLLTDLGLDGVTQLLRNKAEEVVGAFTDNSVDLLHIDGNHSEALSCKDAQLYLPKVKSGGIIFFDDIWWADGGTEVTTRAAILFLLQHCTRLELVGDCMILQKI